MLRNLLINFLVLFHLAGPAVARTPAPAAQAATTPALWQVQPAKGPGRVYLFGTFHLLPAGIRWEQGPVAQALRASRHYLFELDAAAINDPASQTLLLQHGMLPEGQSLEVVVGAELFGRVAAAGETVGLPGPALARMRPWMASILLATQSARARGFEAAHGVESILQARAVKKAIPQAGLETMADQVAALSALDDDGARQMLEETVVELIHADSTFADMLAAWRSGDSARLETAFLSDAMAFPKAYDALLKQRNLRWVPQIEPLLARKSPTFVAVGAAHLVGPDGVVALLRAKGYRVTQLQPKGQK